MARLALWLVLQAMLVSTVMAQVSLTLEVDGQAFGSFARLIQDREAAGTVTLEDGWMRTAFIGLWWPELSGNIEPGAHRFADECAGRRVEVTQVLGEDAHSRSRGWTLLGACPLTCEVEEVEGDGRIRVTRLTLRVGGVGRAM